MSSIILSICSLTFVSAEIELSTAVTSLLVGWIEIDEGIPCSLCIGTSLHVTLGGMIIDRLRFKGTSNRKKFHFVISLAS